MVVTGIALAAMQGLTHGSIAGGVIAAAGAIPACFGMWKGISANTGLGALRGAFGVGGGRTTP